ncbi:MAG: hypothetical protein RMI30_07105 [Thermodesulfovibrio sp.]|nr:hypothetical protein [Thermodesulfovibrio sp.]MDW7999191.1 hypothetical protein [Thermodesulfovibrio sp.]
MYIKLLIFSLLFLLSNSLFAENLNFIPKTFLILPEDSHVKTRWIINPKNKDNSGEMIREDIKFFVDFKNQPNVLYGRTLLINLSTGYLVKIKDDIKDVVCLDNGVLLFSDSKNVGYLEIDKNNEKIPSASIKAITSLPIQGAKLFKGDNTIYASGFSNKTKKYEVYIFDNSKKQFKKIYLLNEPINAVSGKGSNIFIATGGVIKEVRREKVLITYIHPRQEIRELFYNEKVGLIYKTSNGVGLVKNGSALEFLQAEKPIIFLKDKSLYVLFSSVVGVLEIMNIDDLRNYSFKVEKVIDIQQTI